jgi:5-methylcytosine-specific restriction endonuclease McrA
MSWSEGRKKSFITSTLRSGFRRWPPKFEVIKEAFVGKKVNAKTGRIAAHYKCADCGEEFPQKEIQCDHINPVVSPLDGFIDWDTFIDRLFCEASNLQVLCTSCHNKKTKEEKKIRNKK